MQRKGIGPGPVGWLDPRGGCSVTSRSSRTGHGLGLVFYLYLHLAVLSMLLRGEDAWDDFLELATTTIFLFLDVLLLFGMLYHGLNGVRVALVGTGIAPNAQKALWVAGGVIGTVLLLAGGLHILGSA